MYIVLTEVPPQLSHDFETVRLLRVSVETLYCSEYEGGLFLENMVVLERSVDALYCCKVGNKL